MEQKLKDVLKVPTIFSEKNDDEIEFLIKDSLKKKLNKQEEDIDKDLLSYIKIVKGEDLLDFVATNIIYLRLLSEKNIKYIPNYFNTLLSPEVVFSKKFLENIFSNVLKKENNKVKCYMCGHTIDTPSLGYITEMHNYKQLKTNSRLMYPLFVWENKTFFYPEELSSMLLEDKIAVVSLISANTLDFFCCDCTLHGFYGNLRRLLDIENVSLHYNQLEKNISSFLQEKFSISQKESRDIASLLIFYSEKINSFFKKIRPLFNIKTPEG